MNARDEQPPCTPTKPTGNAGACRVDPDGEINTGNELENQGNKRERSASGIVDRILL